MPLDVRLVLDDQGADLAIESGDLARDGSLTTPVLISLFSDARAGDEDPLPTGPEDQGPNVNRRGFWADSIEDRLGSLLWIYNRAKNTAETRNGIEEAVRVSLAWLVEQEIAARVRVTATIKPDRLDLVVEITRGLARRWDDVWAAVRAEDFALPGVKVQLVIQ